MRQALNRLLAGFWHRFAGTWQWYALWLMHDKFIVGVSGVVTDANGNILLLRHRYWKQDSWGLPSGYANRGERLQEAFAREIKEETGYIAEVNALLKVTSGFKLRIEVNFRGKIVGGNLLLDSSEVLEARFFPLHALPNGLLDTHRQLIRLAFSPDKAQQ